MNEYFDRQPTADFVNELKKPVHEKKHAGFGKKPLANGEIDLNGMYLAANFPDPNGLLETAYADFNHFLHVYEMGGNRVGLTIEQKETSCFEEYTLTISADGAKLCAADTEGIRRGLVYLEDLLIENECPALMPRTVTRRPFVKTRITRGFFSPTNRPPHNVDELYNDVDYYPDEYLNRLAHDGNNGIWIYTHFYDLLPSDVIVEYGHGSEKRLEKLRAVVKKCARYGVKVYVFGVEPAALEGELAEKYADMLGGYGGTRKAICPHTPRGRAYFIEGTERLFRAVPDLGGYIAITAGERVTSCVSISSLEKCPRCGQYPRGETLSYTIDLIREGMRRAHAKGEFISWTYEHRNWNLDDMRDYVRTAPNDIMLMQNFDDLGYEDQLGAPRQAIDYWLSYVGPSMLFEETAKEARAYQKHLYAKMQVCCSHEIATVPYIPVPGLIFEKYKAAHRLNVEGILQCWYFGNYPSIMSKAAGELSFIEDFSDEQAFLRHLAGICYGKSVADAVARAWSCFGAGYRQYPLNIMFSYYGPMHDGVVWELALQPKNNPLSRSWLLLDQPNGDRIGESLQCGHDLCEAITLAENMCTEWQKGLEILPHDAVGELATVADALQVLFESGRNILQFYAVREQLGYQQADAAELLTQLRCLTEAEKRNSERMWRLCEADNRLGYHSEAEGFKFFPLMLRERMERLQKMLDTEFPLVAARIAAGQAPLAYYTAENEESYQMAQTAENAGWTSVGDAAFRVSYDTEQVYLDVKAPSDAVITFSFEFRLMWPSAQMIWKNGKLDVETGHRQHQSLFGTRLAREREKYTAVQTAEGVRFLIDRRKCGWMSDTPIKLRLTVNDALWITEENPTRTLGKAFFSPGEFGWLKP